MAGIIKVNQYQDFNGNTLFTSDGSGNLTTQQINFPAFEVYLNGNQTLTDNTETKVAFNVTTFDTDSAFDITTNYRFTVPSGKAGKYCFYCTLNASAQAVSQLDRVIVKFRKNGSTGDGAERGLYHYPSNNPGAQETVTMTATYDLSASDYIEVYALIDDTSGSPVLDSYISTATQMCYFGGYRIGS